MDPQRQHERGAGLFRQRRARERKREQDDLYGVVMPSVSVQGKGARANVGVNAAMEMNDRSGGGTGNFNPLLNATRQCRADRGFLLHRRASRVPARPPRIRSARPAVQSLTENENASTTYSYGITPSIRRRLGGFATFNASTQWDQQISANDDFDDSTQQHFNASLSSGTDFTRLSWGLDGEHTHHGLRRTMPAPAKVRTTSIPASACRSATASEPQVAADVLGGPRVAGLRRAGPPTATTTPGTWAWCGRRARAHR